ncbi:hypothetical protein FVEN_g12721 [Fusarium venenatum]|nr:hypothetical protein FVEN_g12721 [Fusarium venenatum]
MNWHGHGFDFDSGNGHGFSREMERFDMPQRSIKIGS